MRSTFYLDRPNDDFSVVMVNISFSGYRFRLSTGVSLSPSHWDSKRQMPKSSDPRQNVNRRRLNAIVDAIEEAYSKINFGRSKKVLPKEEVDKFKSTIKNFLVGDKPTPPSRSLVEQFNEFIDTYTIRSRHGSVTTKRPSKRSIGKYRKTLETLTEWSAAHKKPLTYDIIDEQFYQSYCSWLGETYNLRDASLANYLKTIKTFMRWAAERDYHTTTAYKRFFHDNRNSEAIALTKDEIKALIELDLSDNPKLDRTRDHFLLQCFTGMRYGDLIKLEPHHFDLGRRLIIFITQKTDTRCVIPVTRQLGELLNRHSSLVFEFASSVKQNVYLKELGKLIGMDQTITSIHYKGGQRVDEVHKRYERLTTHVGRRTYATLSMQLGVPEYVVSRVTGHAAKSQLQSAYLKLDDEAVRDIVIEAWETL